MGDRGNVIIPMRRGFGSTAGADEVAPLFVYTHWYGSALPEMTATCLETARSRWTDPSYATRIFVHKFLSLVTSPDEETGAGLSAHIQDNEHSFVIVDFEHQRVAIRPMGTPEDDLVQPVEDDEGWSFDEYLDASAVAQKGLYE